MPKNPPKKSADDEMSDVPQAGKTGSADDDSENTDVLTYEEKTAAYNAGNLHAYRLLPLDDNEEYARCINSESKRDKDYADEFKRAYDKVDQTRKAIIKRFAKDEGTRLAQSDKSTKSKKRFEDAYNRVPEDKKAIFLEAAKAEIKNDALVSGIIDDAQDMDIDTAQAEEEKAPARNRSAKDKAYNAGCMFAASLQAFGSGRNNPKNKPGSEYAKEYKRGYDSVDQTSDDIIIQFGKTEGKWLKSSSDAGKPNTQRFKRAYERVPDAKRETFLAAAKGFVEEAFLDTIVSEKEEVAPQTKSPKPGTRKRTNEELHTDAIASASDDDERKRKSKRRKAGGGGGGASSNPHSSAGSKHGFFASASAASSGASSSGAAAAKPARAPR